MAQKALDEREFELINIVGADIANSQRDLSKHMNLSLGMTNMLIRRMISKGFIRITQLNQKKVKYILTPKGFAEKMRKSVKYTLKTINSINLIKEAILKVVGPLYESGERTFTVLGKSDFAMLIETVLRELGNEDYRIVYIDELSNGDVEGTLLICKENREEETAGLEKKVNLIYALAEDYTLASFNGE